MLKSERAKTEEAKPAVTTDLTAIEAAPSVQISVWYALLLYVVAFVAILVFGLPIQRSHILPIFGLLGVWLFVVLFVQHRFGSRPPLQVTVPLLLFLFGLLESILWLDDSGSLTFILLFIPLRAFHYFAIKVALPLSLGVWLLFAVQSYSSIGLGPAYSLNLILWTVALSFLIGRALARQRADASHARTIQLFRELEVAHRELQIYAAQTEELVATRERNRIAREIHDSLGHYLTAINVQLERAIVLEQHEPTKLAEVLRETKRMAGEALQDVRRSVTTLRTGPLEASPDFSLVESVQQLVANVNVTQSFKLNFVVEGSEENFAYTTRQTLFRVTQEALTNIQKYAEPAQVEIKLCFGEAEARLAVHDDGRGFDTTILANLKPGRLGGYGLQGSRERLELLGGYLQVESTPGQGTHLLAVAPKFAFTRSGVVL
jgi:signal transduction histidine kinase